MNYWIVTWIKELVQEKNICVRLTFLFADRIKCFHCLIPSMSFSSYASLLSIGYFQSFPSRQLLFLFTPALLNMWCPWLVSSDLGWLISESTGGKYSKRRWEARSAVTFHTIRGTDHRSLTVCKLNGNQIANVKIPICPVRSKQTFKLCCIIMQASSLEQLKEFKMNLIKNDLCLF